ncbi:MAG: ubiquinone/menaquinone biosynthesis methyltransferase [Caldimicrobium thiodismutans]
MKLQKEEHKSFVQRKFDRIVKRYDLVNALASFFQDRLWRKKVASFFKNLDGPFLDLCSGPYTLSFEILKNKREKLFALDLSLEMLLYGRTKKSPLLEFIYPLRGDAERLPFKDNVFSGLSIAFGLRNLPDREMAVSEFYRVLKKGGLLVILEFSMPKNFLIKGLYLIYLKYYIPFLGGLLTGDKEAYKYLSQSIQKFPPPEEIHQLLFQRGFKKLEIRSLTLGVVTLYIYQK